jgi:hypothetical protein
MKMDKKIFFVAILIVLAFLIVYFKPYRLLLEKEGSENLIDMNAKVIKIVDTASNENEQISRINSEIDNYRASIDCEGYLNMVVSESESKEKCDKLKYANIYWRENDDTHRFEYHAFKYFVGFFSFSEKEATELLYESISESFSKDEMLIDKETQNLDGVKLTKFNSMALNQEGEPEYRHRYLFLDDKKIVEIVTVNKDENYDQAMMNQILNLL